MKNNIPRLLVKFVALLCLGFSACSPILKPVSPNVTQKDPPDVPKSFINVSIEVASPPLLDGVKDALVINYAAEPWMDQLGSGGPDAPSCGYGAGYKFYTKRPEIAANLSGNQLQADFKFYYWMKARKRFPFCFNGLAYFSCGTKGESEREMSMQLNTTVTVEPTWTLNVSTAPATIKALNECKFGLWGVYDVTPIITDKIKVAVDGFTSQLRTELAIKVNLRNRVSSLWSEMHKLQKLSESASLMFNTSNLYLHPIVSDNQRVKFGIQIEAKPQVYIGVTPSINVPALPDRGLAPQGTSFKVFLPVEISYETIQKALYKEFKINEGNFLRFPPTGNKWFYVTDLSISGYNDKTIIRLELTGKVKGWIYLSGDPKYDPTTKEIFFDNIALSADSKSWIVRKAGWLANEIPGLTNWITNRSRANISSPLNDAKGTIDSYLNSTLTNGGTSIKLNGNLNAFDFQSLFVDNNKNKVTFYFHAAGDVSGIIQ